MVERKLNRPLKTTQKAKTKPRAHMLNKWLRMAVETQMLKSRNNFSWAVTKKKKKKRTPESK